MRKFKKNSSLSDELTKSSKQCKYKNGVLRKLEGRDKKNLPVLMQKLKDR